MSRYRHKTRRSFIFNAYQVLPPFEWKISDWSIGVQSEFTFKTPRQIDSTWFFSVKIRSWEDKFAERNIWWSIIVRLLGLEIGLGLYIGQALQNDGS